ncbi:uncharacterized protein LOC122505886 [Leptopilina heterotoma]|uniref:uncharacterized protein LOC122505886 n=1 Tax=Leptopilina heterotoma TaxID=63436 RepID=UPI001CAA0760|nr:uncharacterized protein LOC122505886 [Leptopilina heterotoma]
MAARFQGPKEHVQVYFLDKVWLCKGLNLSLDKIRNEVAQGLWWRDMANYAIGRKYETTDDLLHDLVQFESMDSSRRERISEYKGQLVGNPGRKRGEAVTFPRLPMVEGPKYDEKSMVKSGKTPFEALYDYLPRFENGELRELTINREKYMLPADIQREVRDNIVKAQEKYKSHYDKNKFSNVHYEIGDICL